MERYSRGLKSGWGTRLPGLFHSIKRKRIYPLIRVLFGLCCWSAAMWVVWNHALSGFLNADSVGLLPSLAGGAMLYVLSILFDDIEPEPQGKTPEKPYGTS